MFLNQIKHINVGFNSRIFVNLSASTNFYFYSRNLGEFNKNSKFTDLLKCLHIANSLVYSMVRVLFSYPGQYNLCKYKDNYRIFSNSTRTKKVKGLYFSLFAYLLQKYIVKM